MKLLKQLIQSNTGYNSKTFIMLIGVGMTLLTLLTLLPLMYLSVFLHLTVPWYGIASVIGSLASLAGVLIWGKIKTDGYEWRYGNDNVVDNEEQHPQEG